MATAVRRCGEPLQSLAKDAREYGSYFIDRFRKPLSDDRISEDKLREEVRESSSNPLPSLVAVDLFAAPEQAWWANVLHLKKVPSLIVFRPVKRLLMHLYDRRQEQADLHRLES